MRIPTTLPLPIIPLLLLFAALSATLGLGAVAVAQPMTSSNYQLDTNLSGGFGGTNQSANYKMTTIGAEAIVGSGAAGSYKMTQPDDSAEPYLQVALSEAVSSLGTISSGTSQQTDFTVAVTTDADFYNLSIRQSGDLTTSGGATIPAIGASIASPQSWVESSTFGLGFSVVAAPSLDAKWASGTKYAAIPSTQTSFYTSDGGVVDEVGIRFRLGVGPQQAVGNYTNVVTLTGTMLP